MAKNIIIRKRMEESVPGLRYCEIIGTKWFNRCNLQEHRKLQKGDIFNVFRIEYEEDGNGNITRWICDRKYGCEYNGRSIEGSLADLDQEINDKDYLRRYLVPGETGPWAYLKPLEIFLFDREEWTENEAGAVTRQQAVQLADEPKDVRRVWRYNMDCSTFDADLERGSIDLDKFIVRTM